MASLAAKVFEHCSDFILACSIDGFPQLKLHTCMNVLILWKFVKLGISRFFFLLFKGFCKAVVYGVKN